MWMCESSVCVFTHSSINSHNSSHITFSLFHSHQSHIPSLFHFQIKSNSFNSTTVCFLSLFLHEQTWNAFHTQTPLLPLNNKQSITFQIGLIWVKNKSIIYLFVTDMKGSVSLHSVFLSFMNVAVINLNHLQLFRTSISQVSSKDLEQQHPVSSSELSIISQVSCFPLLGYFLQWSIHILLEWHTHIQSIPFISTIPSLPFPNINHITWSCISFPFPQNHPHYPLQSLLILHLPNTQLSFFIQPHYWDKLLVPSDVWWHRCLTCPFPNNRVLC